MLGNGYMKGLEELQHAFGNYLTGADTTVPRNVAGDDKADLKERMDLYAGAYRARLAESLGVDFPCLWVMFGDDQFYQLCLDYIRHHPSTFSSIYRLFPGGGNGGVRMGSGHGVRCPGCAAPSGYGARTMARYALQFHSSSTASRSGVEYPVALGSSGPRR